ncbi:chromosome transmission fidelity protein 8 [Phaeosphaeriaceae sp. PMI808]|nr:chromosome transmission fidelity protein 8 [Phaeosphaeriaceae sp. PMI808]
MPTIPLHIRPPPTTTLANPLPNLLHTPSGLALLELQGTFHFPPSPSPTTLVGKLVFPLYDAAKGASDTAWMKRVYMYVGEGQRLAGEVRRLGKAVGVVRMVRGGDGGGDEEMGGVGERGKVGEGELEVVEVVRFKIVFSNRPEPVGGGEEG